MSIGAPSNLGTLLIQRLDAVLGIGLSQQAALAKDIGPQAVRQPGNPEASSGLQNPVQRDTQEAVDQAAAQGQQRAAVSKATQEMRLANLLGRATTQFTATQSAPTTLGYAARTILALLNTYPEADTSIRTQTALVSNPSQVTSEALVAKIATTLQQSIQSSGLFYESHLAQLTAGASSVQALHQEPQGQLLAATARDPQALPLPSTPPPLQEAPALPGGLAQQIQAQISSQSASALAPDLSTSPHDTSAASTTHAAATASGHTAPGIDPQAQPLVRQQLEVLANQSVVWCGEAWPGAPLRWEIQRRNAKDPRPHDFEGQHWATQLELNLPRLGTVQARLSLLHDQLVLQMTAAQSAPQLDASLETLRTRLLAKGLKASQLSVTQSPPEAPTSTSHEVPFA
ncbi:MAG TPA: flagellar hook-length control protein FliK [Castellaniella sp.]|uniref:flagellar hook-length control protein FliK n=1 Tax=Castellaniella sp. TaxID=1955812 RepID=UPI002F1CC09D